jgi:transcriptional regulator with XRE-family HTH domain
MALPILGARLKKIREKRGWSQTELARRADVHPRQIWRYEQDEAEPTATYLARIASELGVSADYLLGLIDTEDTRRSAEEVDEFERELIEFVRYQPDIQNRLGVSFPAIIQKHINSYTEISTKLTKLFLDRQKWIGQLYALAPTSGFDLEGT